jgi:diadenosine tetraphosphatase ApaH/serine/threonine PP2A family protein phosphatase
MRYLVLSDIHANLEALEAVLDAARDIPYERLLVLGDLVGYGADPNAVVDRIRGLSPHAVIRGNHDKVGAGLEPSDAFNAVARAAIRWTYEALSDDNRDWLAELPAGPLVVDDLLEICHGTPFDEDMYVFDDGDVLRAMQSAEDRATCRLLRLDGVAHRRCCARRQKWWCWPHRTSWARSAPGAWRGWTGCHGW